MGRNRAALIAAVVAAVAVAVVAVLLVAGGDDDEPTVSRPSATLTAPPPTATTPTRTTGTSPTTPPLPPKRDAAGIQRTVTGLVMANERGDAAVVCRILGQPAGGSGLDALDRCGRSAGVDLTVLPSSDELSVERTAASGARGTAYLTGGGTISLRRSGRAWRVTGIRR